MKEKYNKYSGYIVLALILIGVILFVGSCDRMSSLKTDLTIAEQNNKSLSDSLRTSENKVGDLESSINILVTSKKGLKDLSADLANELGKEKGKVSELNKIIAEFKPGTIEVPVFIWKNVDDSGYTVAIKYDTTYDVNNYRSLHVDSKFNIDTNGILTPLKGIIKKDVLRFDLVTGLREKDGNIEIFARSNYPHLKFKHIEGAIIDPKNHPVIKKFTKPKKIGIGPYVGIGLGGDLKLGVQLGVGVTYNFLQF